MVLLYGLMKKSDVKASRNKKKGNSFELEIVHKLERCYLGCMSARSVKMMQIDIVQRQL